MLPQASREPAKERAVPKLAVLRLQDPVAFVREDHQFRWNAGPLKRREEFEALRIGHAEIKLSGDHKRRCLVLSERTREFAGRPFLVKLRIRPGRSAHFPLLKPELLGGSIQVEWIPRWGMTDEALEATRMRGDPVDHVSAVGTSGGSQAGAIDEWILRNLCVDTFHQVLVHPAAPIAADLFGEFV